MKPRKIRGRQLYELTDEELKQLADDIASVALTGRTTDGRRVRPLTDREMGANHINWAKRRNFDEEAK